ncbi:Prophage CP4-57 regulatory protein (AlpA) [compost metagenome]
MCVLVTVGSPLSPLCLFEPVGPIAEMLSWCESPLFRARVAYVRQRSSVLRIIRLRGVISSTGLARSTIYKLISLGEFPKPVPLVGRSVGWIESEVHGWILSRIEERDLAESPSA